MVPRFLCLAVAVACASGRKAAASPSLFSAVTPGKRRGAARAVADVYGVGEALDRYAMALAATEPLRASRDRSVRRAIGRARFFLLTGVRRRNACDPRCRSPRVRRRRRTLFRTNGGLSRARARAPRWRPPLSCATPR